MAKIQIKSEIVTPFNVIFPILDAFDRFLGKIVSSTFYLSSSSSPSLLYGLGLLAAMCLTYGFEGVNMVKHRSC